MPSSFPTVPLASIYQIPSPTPNSTHSLGDIIAANVTDSGLVHTLLDCLPCTSAPAIRDPSPSREPLTHASLHRFVSSFRLPFSSRPLGRNDRVMVVLPTGPANALALIALAAYHTCAPVNATCTANELRDDARRLRARAVFTTPEMEDRLELRSLHEDLGLEIVYMIERSGDGEVGLFDMRTIDGVSSGSSRGAESSLTDRLHSLADKSLVLHTSGTSGKKKIVPYSLRSLIVGTCAVIKSWDIHEDDVNMNMMPLFHVGGIVRNLLAPVLSGGSVIMCSGFDADTFWTVQNSVGATWYYAAPTMHHAILAARSTLSASSSNSTLVDPETASPLTHNESGRKIRMVCNAAGGLLPSLALELKDTFDGAVILPSYGMTECMPIASPPSTYTLDRPGTSGIACGPHLSIRTPGGAEKELPRGEVGAICVRGLPTFEGYEVPPEDGNGNSEGRIDTSAITEDGWFDSGDMGWMDKDGYLYITGRSKEIINKGGEVISPFEIEEAIMIASQGRVKTTLAFAVPHNVLQETIGVVIVPQPGENRISLPSLLALLANSLHPSKWPALIVYMDALPVNAAGKPLRIGLSARFGLEEVHDGIETLARHFEARELDPDQLEPGVEKHKAPIPCHRVHVDTDHALATLKTMDGVEDATLRFRASDGSLEAFISTDPRNLHALDVKGVREALSRCMHDYEVPEHVHLINTPLPVDASGAVDYDALLAMVALNASSAMSPHALTVRRIISTLLFIDENDINVDSDFFLLGGNSLLLGRLAYFLRKETGASLQISTLFTNSTVGAIAKMVELEDKKTSRGPSNGPTRAGSAATLKDKDGVEHFPKLDGDDISYDGSELPYGTKPKQGRGQNHPLSLFVQAIPLIFFYPMKAALTWTILLYVLASLAKFTSNNYFVRMACLICAIIAGRLGAQIFSPLTAIAFKWLVIGRYKPGTYSYWSIYHLRWWIVDQAIRSAGRGVFLYHPSLFSLYLRMLGAKVGKGVSFDAGAKLGEFDLLEFQDGCRVDRAVVRGFCVEREGMFKLDKVVLEKNVVVNTYTQIAPGTVLKEETAWGPHASSFDGPSGKNLISINRSTFAKPKLAWKLFFAWPIIFVVLFISYIPWLAILYVMLSQTPINVSGLDAVESVLWWFADKERIIWHTVARVVRAICTPLVRVLLGIVVKRLLGLNKEGPIAEATQYQLTRRYISNVLLSQGALKGAFEVLGTHYEATSWIFRGMGAKIGKRVYWPGSGIHCPDPELLEIGDDVVFGSRSEFFTTDALGSKRIVVGAGAMIADRCVLLPGVIVGRKAVMGSGCLAKRDGYYEDNSTWMGNYGGDAVCLSSGSKEVESTDTKTPFGKAFYDRKADFFVVPYSGLFSINLLVVAISAAFWSIAAVVAAVVLRQFAIHLFHRHLFRRTWFQFGTMYGFISIVFIAVLAIQSLIVFAWVIAAKWAVIGRRKQGSYHWDKSSYCQRWQLHLTLSHVMFHGHGNGVLSYITGSAYIVWFYRALGLKAGRNVSLFAGGRVGLMTEPDLVELGDNVALDDCSVVAHINSRGQFALNPLKIGEGSAMRVGSRLLSGASMEDNSMLMEHTLLLSGDIAESNTVYAGWPAQTFDVHKTMVAEAEAVGWHCLSCHEFRSPQDILIGRCGHSICQQCLGDSMPEKRACLVCENKKTKRSWRKMFFLRRSQRTSA